MNNELRTTPVRLRRKLRLSRRSLGEGGINQKWMIMQNKPNLPNAQMNVNKVLTKDYENVRLHKLWENKANSKPKQTQFIPTEGGSNPIFNPKNAPFFHNADNSSFN